MSGKWEVRSQNGKFKTIFFFKKGGVGQRKTHRKATLTPQTVLTSVGQLGEKATKERICLLSETLLLPGSVVNSWCPPGQGRVSGALCGSAAAISSTEGQQWMPMFLVVAMPQNKESER